MTVKSGLLVMLAMTIWQTKLSVLLFDFPYHIGISLILV